MRRKERYRMVKLEAEARRTKEKTEHQQQRDDRFRETEVKTMKKSLKRSQKKARKKMAIQMDKLAKIRGNVDPEEKIPQGNSDPENADVSEKPVQKALLGRFVKRPQIPS